MSECTPMVVLPGTSGFTPSTGAAPSNVTHPSENSHFTAKNQWELRVSSNRAAHRIAKRAPDRGDIYSN